MRLAPLASCLMLPALLLAGCGHSATPSVHPKKRTHASIPLPTAPAPGSGAIHPIPPLGGTPAAMRVVSTQPPPGGIPANVMDISLDTPSTGVAVIGGFMNGGFGGLSTTTPGAIAYTSDGGSTWDTVWSQKNADLFWVGQSLTGSLSVASGVTVSANSTTAQPLLLTSSDGQHWEAIAPAVPASVLGLASGNVWQWLRFTFLSPQVGFAVPDPQETVGGLGDILRTVDGGRTWSLVQLPGGQGTGGIAFATAHDGIATGMTSHCSALWQTEDAGASWTMVPGTCCSGGFDSVAFASQTLGYAGGGQSPKFGGFAMLWRTVDGGSTWQEVYDQKGGGPIAALHASGSTVWASVGACVMGQSAPCGGGSTVSQDEGKTFSGVFAGGSHLTAVNAQTAMGVQPFFGQVWRTDDGGTRVHNLASSRSLTYQRVTAMGTSDLSLSTNAGTFFSTDGGATYTAGSAANVSGPYMPGLNVSTEFSPNGQRLTVTVQSGTASPTSVEFPADGSFSAPFAMSSPKSGVLVLDGGGCSNQSSDMPVYATNNGGESWLQVGSLPMSAQAVAVSGETVAVMGDAKSFCVPEVAVSTDGGHTFVIDQPASDQQCDSSAVAQGTVWLLCETSAGLSGTANSEILRSTDGGRSWTGFEAKRFGTSSIAATSATEAFLTSGQGFWETRNGGATLTQIWPEVPAIGR